MQIWRMKPDGTGQEQVTNDEFNNWFPHISPDGKSIVVISYGRTSQPDEHPFYKHVYCATCRSTAASPKVIAYVYGGQGTINVPSWSPDGTRIAFVSNSQIDRSIDELVQRLLHPLHQPSSDRLLKTVTSIPPNEKITPQKLWFTLPSRFLSHRRRCRRGVRRSADHSLAVAWRGCAEQPIPHRPDWLRSHRARPRHARRIQVEAWPTSWRSVIWTPSASRKGKSSRRSFTATLHDRHRPSTRSATIAR